MPTHFIKLNHGWNAEPNAPHPSVALDNGSVKLTFYVNAFQFESFDEDEVATLTFSNVHKYRMGPTNDEGWYRGQCRFSKIAPQWGEFYEIIGDTMMNKSPNDWIEVSGTTKDDQKHYLFYLKDETFECIADSWCLNKEAANKALVGTPLRGAPQL